jgi:hypothetical protein
MGSWLDLIPAEFVLPDTVAEIEAGRPTQGKLFQEPSELETLRQRKDKYRDD